MKWTLSLLSFLLFSTTLFAQRMTEMQIDQDLSGLYAKISSFPYGGGNRLDSLEYYDSLFAQKILFYTSHYFSTLVYPFDSLKKQIHLISSRDGNFRIYSWDTRDGGSMHSFRNLFQYKSGDRIYSKLSADTGRDQYYDPGVFYVHMYRLKKRVYLALGNGIYSHSEMGTRIKIFSIEGQTLNDTLKLIYTPNGSRVNSIDISYNILLNYPDTDFMIPHSVEYNPESKILSVPLITGDHDSMTNRSHIYQFKGNHFQYLKTKN